MESSQKVQNVIVMRHGDRKDHAEPLWITTAERPWDPPLIEAGKLRAFTTAQKISPFPIHRVFVSPFYRCVQTASSAVSALSASGLPIKVSIEYGLCEMLNTEAIREDVAPKDGKFSFNIAELEAMFPAGTVDHSVVPIYPELPKWGETVLETRTRYTQIVKSLADKYPTENLLLVTHAEGVSVALTAFMTGITVYEVEYCANVHLRRKISNSEGKSVTAGNFEVVRPLTGISFFPLSTTTDRNYRALLPCPSLGVSFLRKPLITCSFSRKQNGDAMDSKESLRRTFLFLLVSSGFSPTLASYGKTKSKNPYDEKRLLEQNKRIQRENNAPEEFPSFVREGFQVKVVTPENYITRDSGLIYRDFEVGEGDCAKDGQQVIFHYVGYNESGRRIDSTYLQGSPAKIRMGTKGLVPGFEEGIKDMRPGGKRRMIISPELGPPVGPSTFFSAKQFEVFDVELLSIQDCQRRTIGFYSDVVCN